MKDVYWDVRPKPEFGTVEIRIFDTPLTCKAPHNQQSPYLYKTPQLPFYDPNLRNLAQKISPHCFLAHLRGVPYQEEQVVANQNVHPFMFPETNIALAHNGSLHDFENIRYSLLSYIKDEYKKHILEQTVNGTMLFFYPSLPCL